MALARRHALPAAKEPEYEMQDVPRCKRTMQGACVHKVEDRDEWIRALPELLLLCNEASVRHELHAKRCAMLEENELERKEIEKQKHAESPSQTGDLGDGCVESPSTNGEDTCAEDGSKDGNVLASPCRERKKSQMVLPIHTGKPLSFEYIADRLDLDDPLHGYIVRDKATGWIQGFVTVTTFTTWQKWFRFDSLADEAGLLMFEQEGKGREALHEMGLHLTDDAVKDARTMKWWNERLVDGDGSLARALNLELRDGDVNSEGVIWPRVAELSLLGALGCGSWLVKLIIEELEQPDSPYNYIMLQATENSVPFYESQGFVRVGAVARYVGDDAVPSPSPRGKKAGRKSKTMKGKSAASPSPPKEPQRTPVVPTQPYEPSTSSPFKVHIVDKATPTIKAVAAKHGVQAKDVLFFNRRMHPSLVSVNTKLEQGMSLRIPVFPASVDPMGEKLPSFSAPIRAGETRSWVGYDGKPGVLSKSKLWYTARDNETPMKIAKKLGVDTQLLCQVNRSTYPTIHKRSPLQKGTILRVPGQRPVVPGVSGDEAKKRDEVLTSWTGVDENVIEPNLGPVMCYRHWAFSDDPVQLTHASYMMVRPLRKKKHNKAIADSKVAQLKWLQCPQPLPFEYGTTSVSRRWEAAGGDDTAQKITIRLKCRALKKAKTRIGPFVASTKTVQPVVSQETTGLSELNGALECRKRPLARITQPLKSLEKRRVYFSNCPLIVKGTLKTLTAQLDAPLKPNFGSKKHKKLFNTVVRLLPKESRKARADFYASNSATIDGVDYSHLFAHRAQHEERAEEQYQYFYVLTYIPDLQWTRLAPMHQDGVFEEQYGNYAGRAKWVLVPEGKGHEIDVSASRCVIVRSKAVCGTKDADEEQWAVGYR